MPNIGWDCVTVPGCVSAWVTLSKRFGRLPFSELFKPAISYAENGFFVSPITAKLWQAALPRLQEFPDIIQAFFPKGRAPLAGELFQCPPLAKTLREIAETEGESFYRGKIADKIATASKLAKGLLSKDDLANHQPFWVETISQNYRQCELHEIPPNGQGLAALIALGILEQFTVFSPIFVLILNSTMNSTNQFNNENNQPTTIQTVTDKTFGIINNSKISDFQFFNH